jgi:hypothetical protein
MNLKFTSTTLELGVVVTRFQLIKISEGPRGANGEGVPDGGTTNQILAKASNDDYDTQWVNPPSGGGGSGVSGDTPVFIQASAPSHVGAYSWWDTSGGDLTLWIEDGV